MKLTTVKENLFALVIALVLAFSVVLIINNTDFLKADILSWQEWEEYSGDVVYYIEESELVIKSNTSISSVNTISIDIVYDNELSMDSYEVDSSYDYSKSSISWVWDKLILLNVWSISSDEDLIKIPFDWEDWQINISDIVVNFTDGSSERLSVTWK